MRNLPPSSTPTRAPTSAQQRAVPPAVVVILAGVVAAMHIGKMPPAIPALRDALSVTLIEAGFLLSAAQVAGMLVGVMVGGLTDGLGLRRSLLLGLGLLSTASLAGAWAQQAHELLALRALEGLGVLLVALPAPSLLRQLVAPAALTQHLGLWGAYMPTGTAASLVLGPWVIQWLGWQGLWVGMAALTVGMALWVARGVPAPPAQPAPSGSAQTPTPGHGPVQRWLQRLWLTLSHPAPWWVALAFAMYSSQWLAVIGFLPSVYAQANVGAAAAGGLTALVCGINITGNVAAGRLLHRGWPATRLLGMGFVSMAVSTWLAFHPLTAEWPLLRYAACLAFSSLGGLIPGTLFSLAVRVAPSEQAISTTMGWVQQCSSTGQFLGPPLVAWVADRVGGWHLTWAVTGTASVVGLGLVLLLHRTLQAMAQRRPPHP